MKNYYQTLIGGLVVLAFSAGITFAEDTSGNSGAVKASAASAQTTPAVKSKKAKTVKKAKTAKEIKAPEKTVYICPMCHIKADKPGKCPECGMDMVKMPKEAEKEKK
jgi:rubrerythrin